MDVVFRQNDCRKNVIISNDKQQLKDKLLPSQKAKQYQNTK